MRQQDGPALTLGDARNRHGYRNRTPDCVQGFGIEKGTELVPGPLPRGYTRGGAPGGGAPEDARPYGQREEAERRGKG